MKIKHTLKNETMKLSHFNKNHVSTKDTHPKYWASRSKYSANEDCPPLLVSTYLAHIFAFIINLM